MVLCSLTAHLRSLDSFRGVIVTGPHRSGTTITGRIIAHELNRRYVTETQVQTIRGRHIDCRYVEDWIDAQKEPFVLHGATCFGWLPDLQRYDLATVFVRRPSREIIESQKRAGVIDQSPSTKKSRWRDWLDRRLIRHPHEIEYHQLKDHPLWVEDRTGWAPRQIGPDETAHNTEGFRK